MKGELIGKRLQNNEIVYIKDDFEEIAIRFMPNEDGTVAYAKFKGKTEYIIDRASKLVYNVEMGGVEISKQEYEDY